MFALAIGGLGLLVGPPLAFLVEFAPDNPGGGRGATTCHRCGARPAASSYLPVLGALTRCGACGRNRRAADLAVPLVAGVTFLVVALVVGNRWQLLPLLVFSGALIVLAAIDIERFRLPDRVLFPALALSALAVVAVSLTDGPDGHLLPALVGSLSYFGLLLVPNLVNPAGLAFGDVKLALLLGLGIGWMRASMAESLVLVIYALMIGMLLGIVSGLLVGVGRRIIGPGFLPDPDADARLAPDATPLLRTAFPFGPALALSALAGVLLSGSLVNGPGPI